MHEPDQLDQIGENNRQVDWRPDEVWKNISICTYFRLNGRVLKQVYRCNEDGLVVFEPTVIMNEMKFWTEEQIQAKNRESWKDVISTLRLRTS